MNKKNMLKKTICFLFVLCGLAGGMMAERLALRAAGSEKKLYMEYLAKEEKRVQKQSKQARGKYYDPNGDGINNFKIIDLNNDGKKELILRHFNSGDKPQGFLCSIQNGQVKEIYGWFWFYDIYKVKGSKGEIAAQTYESSNIVNYTEYTLSTDGLKEQSVYKEVYDMTGKDKVDYYKDDKKISKKAFQDFQNKLDKVKMDDYHKSVKKKQPARSEREIYLEYLAKTEKKLQKKYQKLDEQENGLDLDHLVRYKIIDLNNDGKKELLYNFSVPGAGAYNMNKGRICTIRNGKVKKLWKSDERHAVSYATLKGSKTKVVIDEYVTTGGIYTVYDLSSNKMKKVSSYAREQVVSGDGIYYYRENGTKVKDPFGKESEKLKYIELDSF